MTNISFSENSEGYLIPLEDGKSLCDVADPTAQAQAWVNEQNLTIANEIVVLGLGAGFHIQQLQEAHPYLKIHVVECRDQLAPIYRKQIQSQLENYSCFHNLEELFASDVFEVTMRKSLPVYFLRQSWGSQEETFFSFWKSLTGRSAYSMARHFANLGLEVDDESLSLLKNTDRPLTIKDATDIIIQSKGPKAQEQRNYFEALRELVK